MFRVFGCISNNIRSQLVIWLLLLLWFTWFAWIIFRVLQCFQHLWASWIVSFLVLLEVNPVNVAEYNGNRIENDACLYYMTYVTNQISHSYELCVIRKLGMYKWLNLPWKRKTGVRHPFNIITNWLPYRNLPSYTHSVGSLPLKMFSNRNVYQSESNHSTIFQNDRSDFLNELQYSNTANEYKQIMYSNRCLTE